MATACLAEDTKHHRQVAIKVLRPELSAAIGAARFLQEIELTASLQHPPINAFLDRILGPVRPAPARTP